MVEGLQAATLAATLLQATAQSQPISVKSSRTDKLQEYEVIRS